MTQRWATPSSWYRALIGSAGLSIAVHAVLIGAAVVATGMPDGPRDTPEMNIIARFLAPPDREGGQEGQSEKLRFVALPDAQAVVMGAQTKRIEEIKAEPEKPLSGFDPLDLASRPEIKGMDSVFTEIEVDSAAKRYAWSAAPAYPKEMLDAKRDGYVKAQWIVDEAGFVDTASFRLVDYTSKEFAKAVHDALPFMRFSPARFGNKPVKQLVEQEFTFHIIPADPAPKKPPQFLQP